VLEEKTIGTKDEAAFAAVNPTSTTSVDTDDAPAGAKNNNSDDQAPIRRPVVTTVVEVTLVSLRLPRQEDAKADVLQEEHQ
jgi:hypothetical protein